MNNEYILLTVTFRDPIIRDLAIKAADGIAGEDGWTACKENDDPVNRKYPATINCTETRDAVLTASAIIEAFESAYRTSLEGHGLEVTFHGN